MNANERNAKALREEVIKLHKSASAKISRIKRTTGANVAGSEFDVRRNLNNVQRYNVRQLSAYKAELSNFMRRGNQFVGGDKGAPIFRGTFQKLKSLEKEHEAIRVGRDLSMGGIQTPSGLTVRQNKAQVPEGHGSSVYGPYKKFDRQAFEITGEESAKALIKDMQKRLSSNYLPTKIEQGKENLIKVLDILGESDYVDQVLSLSDYQFDLFWFGTNVPESIFMQYGIEKERAAGTRKERWQDKVIESAAEELGPVLEWASQQTPERTTQKTRARKGRTR